MGYVSAGVDVRCVVVRAGVGGGLEREGRQESEGGVDRGG